MLPFTVHGQKYVHTYIRTYTYIHTNAHASTYAHVHTHTHTCTHTHTHMCTHTCTHTYAHVHTRTCADTRAHTHTHTHTHMCMHTHTHTHPKTLSNVIQLQPPVADAMKELNLLTHLQVSAANEQDGQTDTQTLQTNFTLISKQATPTGGCYGNNPNHQNREL